MDVRAGDACLARVIQEAVIRFPAFDARFAYGDGEGRLSISHLPQSGVEQTRLACSATWLSRGNGRDRLGRFIVRYLLRFVMIADDLRFCSGLISISATSMYTFAQSSAISSIDPPSLDSSIMLPSPIENDLGGESLAARPRQTAFLLNCVTFGYHATY